MATGSRCSSGSRTASSRRSGFTGRGCAISQASASLLTDEIKGKPLEDVAGLRAADLLDLLGIEISPARLKCAMLSFDSLQHLLGEVGATPLPGEGARARRPDDASGRCACRQPA